MGRLLTQLGVPFFDQKSVPKFWHPVCILYTKNHTILLPGANGYHGKIYWGRPVFGVLFGVVFGILAKRAQDGSQMAQEGAKMVQDRAKTELRWPQIGPRHPKTAPKHTKTSPRRSEMVHDRSKTGPRPQNGPKMVSNC